MPPFAGWERIEMARDQFDDVFDVDGDEVISPLAHFPPRTITAKCKMPHNLAKFAVE
jgi:hypothetical protein